DIDGQKRDAVELHRAKEAAERASQIKTEFLAHMTHELRTPLNGVIGMIDLLASTTLDDRQRRYTQVARASADLVLSVIDDILDFSKIEAGRLELEHVPFRADRAVEDVVVLLTQPAQDRDVRLSCRIGPGLEQPLIGDPARLRQVLINLVSNALKF